MAQPSPENRILECIDRGMGTLGESSRAAIYWHIGHTCGVTREQIPRNPRKFRECLESILGLGAGILEKLIVQEIRSAFKIPAKVESLEESVKKAMAVDN